MWIWAKNAWQGWQQFISLGKLPALLIAALLWMVLGGKRGETHEWGNSRRQGEAHEWGNSRRREEAREWGDGRGQRDSFGQGDIHRKQDGWHNLWQKGAKGRLLYYGVGMTICCIFPGTAVLLMKYQTAFYDYPFIWSLVPMTALLGLGGTLFLTGYWRKSNIGLGYKSFFYNAFLTFACAAILFLCGGIGKSEAASEAAAERERAFEVLSQVQERMQALDRAGTQQTQGAVQERGAVQEQEAAQAQEAAQEQEAVQERGAVQEQEAAQTREAAQTQGTVQMEAQVEESAICLWAPKEILSYARLWDGGLTLLYGRNMWDVALNAYTYDVYPEEVRQLYFWMEGIPAGADAAGEDAMEGAHGEAELREYIERAFSLGANCVLLPEDFLEELPTEWQESIDWAEVFALEDYYMLCPR